MVKLGFDYAVMYVIGYLNRETHDVPKMKDLVFFYDNRLKCWTDIRKAVFKGEQGGRCMNLEKSKEWDNFVETCIEEDDIEALTDMIPDSLKLKIMAEYTKDKA